MSDEQNSVTFVSPTNDLRLVREPARRRMIGETGDYEMVPGASVQFRDGVLVTSDEAEVSWLRDHEQNGGIFHERGNEPGRVGGDTADIHREIIKLAFAGSYDAIADILLKERSSLSRPDVLAACEQALDAGGAPEVPLPETPAHELIYQRDAAAVGNPGPLVVSQPPATAPVVMGEPPAPPAPPADPTAGAAPTE